MSLIDDTYLINLLQTSLQNFKNELIIHKVSNINCNFIEFIIYNSPQNIIFLDEYYKYFNDININIIKNTRNSQDELLVNFYRNINTEKMDLNIINHISFFLKTQEITNNIIDLFSDNFILNNDNIINDNNLNIMDNNNENDCVLTLRCNINKINQDIKDLKKEIEIMKNDIYLKIDKLCKLINVTSLESL